MNEMLLLVLILSNLSRAAEVSGEGSGLRLILTVKSTEIRAHQPIAARVTLQNTGKVPVEISDPAFDDRKGPRWGFSRNNSYKRHMGINFNLRSEDGKEIPWDEPSGPHCPDDLFRKGTPTEEELREGLFRVERNNVAEEAAEEWVEENTRDPELRNRLKALIGPKTVRLPPGGSLKTGAYTYQEKCLKAPSPQWDTGFAHLLGYYLRAGRYRLSVSYTPPGKKSLVTTPPLEITVR